MGNMATREVTPTELTRATMVNEPVLGRFAIHDLLRDYGAELGTTRDPDSDRRAAVERLLDPYLHGAHAAAVRLNPHRDPIAVRVDKDGCLVKPGKPDGGTADCVLKTSPEIFTRIVREAYTPSPTEFMTGAIKSNDIGLLLTFQKVFQLGN